MFGGGSASCWWRCSSLNNIIVFGAVYAQKYEVISIVEQDILWICNNKSEMLIQVRNLLSHRQRPIKFFYICIKIIFCPFIFNIKPTNYLLVIDKKYNYEP